MTTGRKRPCKKGCSRQEYCFVNGRKSCVYCGWPLEEPSKKDKWKYWHCDQTGWKLYKTRSRDHAIMTRNARLRGGWLCEPVTKIERISNKEKG